MNASHFWKYNMYCYMWVMHVKNLNATITWICWRRWKRISPRIRKKCSICWLQCIRLPSKRVRKHGYFYSWLEEKPAGKIWLTYYDAFLCQSWNFYCMPIVYSLLSICKNKKWCLPLRCLWRGVKSNVLKALQQCV